MNQTMLKGDLPLALPNSFLISLYLPKVVLAIPASTVLMIFFYLGYSRANEMFQPNWWPCVNKYCIWNMFSILSSVITMKTLKITYDIGLELSWFYYSFHLLCTYVMSSKLLKATDYDMGSIFQVFHRWPQSWKKCNFWHFDILVPLCSLGNKGSQAFASLAFGHSYYSFHHPVIVISQKVHWLLWSQSTQLKIQFKCL